MTREERTKLIKHLKYNRSIGADYLITDEDADEIIKALEQEPCEDAISRADMLDAIGHGATYTSEELQKIIKGLPPVNPQQKTGHWINLNKDHTGECDDNGNPYVRCSECGCFNGTDRSDYCPDCGAKMEGME